MTISRIDDADRMHVTYQNKVSHVIWVKVAVSVVILFIGVFAYGFISMNSDSGDYVWLITFVLIAFQILTGYLKMMRNNNYFSAYVIDGDVLYRVDLTEAFSNDTLLGKSYSISNRNGVFQRMKIAHNMSKMPATSHIDDFICRKEVIAYGGYVIENVFDIEEGEKFLRVKLQMKGFRLFNSYSHKKTVYIPNSFTNLNELRYELERRI